jgi:hypothetical protein
MGLAGRRNGGAAGAAGHGHDDDDDDDDAESHGLPCVPDANAVGADARWYHGSRAGIKRFLSTGDQGPGYSKLETTTSAQPDWRDVDAAFVSLLFDRFPVCIYSCTPAPPIWFPFTQALSGFATLHCLASSSSPSLFFSSLGFTKTPSLQIPPFLRCCATLQTFPQSYRNSSSAGRLTTFPIAISFLQKNTSKHSPL